MEPESGWSSLEPGLIANVLNALKRSNSFKRVAPPLRLLNKHWRLEVDHHVLSVSPHHSRSIVAEDLVSLLKFHNLASLDATRFVCAYEAEELPSIVILSQLCHLSRLKLASESWSGIGVNVLSALTGVSALILETGVRSHVPERDLIKLSGLPLKELSIRCPINNMGPLFQRCRTVERLDAQVLPADIEFPFDAAWMNGLTSLKLSFRTIGRSFELPDLQHLSVVTTLSELDLCAFCSADLDWLVHLPHLKSLRITVATMDVLMTVAFLHMLEKLRSFHLSGVMSHALELGSFIRRGSNLSHLSLDGVQVDCLHIKENYHALEHLALHRCRFLNSQYFLSELKPLKELAFQCQRDPFGHLHLKDAVLSHLTTLKVALLEMDALSCIARLTNLVTLGLRTPYPLSLQALRHLGSLPGLVDFGVSPPFPESAVSTFLKLDMLTSLQMLYLSDESGNFNAASLQLLRDQLPRLKIEMKIEAFDAFMKAL